MSVLTEPNKPVADPAATATLGGQDASTDASWPHSGTSAEITPAELEAKIVDAAGLMHRSRHQLITALTAYDRSGAWALAGAHNCARWVADRLGVHIGTAREWLRIGHALAELTLLDTAMAESRLSYCAVRKLTRLAVEHPDHEAELVEIAEHSTPGRLSKALAGWALDHETDEQRETRERSDTWFSARVEPDAMGTIHIHLPAIDMARIQAAVDARVMQSRRTDPDNPNPTLGHQRAHALLELLGCTGDNTGKSGGKAETPPAKVATEIIVHVRADGCSMHDGTPIADNAVASLIDESFVRVLIHNADNRPVNASTRRRHPTPRQKRVVDEHHRECVDCGSDELIQYDHVPPYSISQRTHTDELYPRCPACHARRHETEPR